MNLLDLFSLQGTLFALMLLGAYLKKKGILDENGKRCLSDLCIGVVIPANIFKSCLIPFNKAIFHSSALLLVSAVLLQILALVLNRFMYNHYNPQRKKVLQYCTIVPMSGFLGNPIAEGIYDKIGVLYTSIFLIPMRIIMWSVGTSYFVADETMDKKKVLKNVLTHPCLVAIYLGLFCMFTQLPVPGVIRRTVTYVGNCNSALTMFIVGTILADVKLSTIVNKDTLSYSLLRLVLLPAAAFATGHMLHLEGAALGVSVLMTGMPAGATAAIFASKYHSDALFATQCVVMSTLLSMVTLPVISYLAG